MPRTRAPAVAGQFYPEEPDRLEALVRSYLDEARKVGNRSLDLRGAPPPKAMVVPHAGYVYSGPVAGSAYVRLEAVRDRIARVVILGPSHQVPLRGLAVSGVDEFSTPLGRVPVDRETEERLCVLPQVSLLRAAHRTEHSLEVQLPFLQVVLDEFTLVPLSVGDATPEEIDVVLDAVWDGPETLILISSDLSHYFDYETAKAMDAKTSKAIEGLRYEEIGEMDACGRVALRGLLRIAQRKGLGARTLDLRSSGDTAGSRDRVVGYGAYVVA